ncbi:hypothetical protein Cni_G12329 [Canna indica]|uniref:Uncharacterized protein n=1 Tax=Canna indica TaxID=4628 RepID=A0AAQ3K853_9LILI|nr:hypothetical protein Cni_G12329 [Canna indica]
MLKCAGYLAANVPPSSHRSDESLTRSPQPTQISTHLVIPDCYVLLFLVLVIPVLKPRTDLYVVLLTIEFDQTYQ